MDDKRNPPSLTYTDASGSETIQLGEKRLIDEFYAISGYAINQWAHIDRKVFECFHLALGATEQKAAILYYTWQSFSQRCQITDELICATYDNKEIITEWSTIFKEFKKLTELRNMLAHQPIVGKSEFKNISHIDPIKKYEIKNWLEVSIEEKELLRGKRTPKTVTVNEIIDHVTKLNASLEKLTELTKKMVH